MFPVSRRLIRSTPIFLLVILSVAGAWAAQTADIIGVKVAPDGRHIRILRDGQAVEPNHFAVKDPNRLILDFGGVRLRNGPAKVAVSVEPVKEIRLGYFGSRARVVVDFGANPTPAYRVHNEGSQTLVLLDIPRAAPAAAVNPKRSWNRDGMAAVDRKKAGPRTKKPASARRRKKQGPGLSIRSAAAKQDLVVIELADLGRPERTCRLVLEVDPDTLTVKRAVVTDKAGNMRIGNLGGAKVASSKPPTTREGARKPPTKRQTDRPSAVKGKLFQWGAPAVKGRGPTAGPRSSGGPIRLPSPRGNGGPRVTAGPREDAEFSDTDS